MGPYGVDSWRKSEAKNLVLLCLLKPLNIYCTSAFRSVYNDIQDSMCCTTSHFFISKDEGKQLTSECVHFFIVSYSVQLTVLAHSRSSSFFFSLNALSAFPFSRLPFNFPICVQSCLSTEHCQVCFSRLPSVSILACSPFHWSSLLFQFSNCR
jgi:hypothetical protein